MSLGSDARRLAVDVRGALGKSAQARRGPLGVQSHRGAFPCVTRSSAGTGGVECYQSLPMEQSAGSGVPLTRWWTRPMLMRTQSRAASSSVSLA